MISPVGPKPTPCLRKNESDRQIVEPTQSTRSGRQ
jgi:hypothetical protein